MRDSEVTAKGFLEEPLDADLLLPPASQRYACGVYTRNGPSMLDIFQAGGRHLSCGEWVGRRL